MNDDMEIGVGSDDRPTFPTPGQSVEAIDVVGHWCKATIVEWVNEGDCIGPDTEHAGPGFEVQFENWTSKSWNRVVPLEEIRPPTQQEDDHKRRRQKVKNVRTLHLHSQQQEEVIVDGVCKTVTIKNVDPIRNVVNAVCGEELLILNTSNFETRKRDELEDNPRKCSKIIKKQKANNGTDPVPEQSPESVKVPRKQTVDGKKRRDRNRGKVSKHKERNKDTTPEPTCLSPDSPRDESVPIKMHLPMAMGKDGFLGVGDLCFFFGAVLVVNLITLLGETITVVGSVCALKDGLAVGIEDGCEVQARPDMLSQSSVKLSSAFKRHVNRMRSEMVLSMRYVGVGSPVYNARLRQLKIGQFLRNACSDLLQARALSKTVSTVNDANDFHIFVIDGMSVTYTIEHGFEVLDAVMGHKWDVHPCSTHPMSHFDFIRAISISVSLGTITFALKKGRSIVPMLDNYRCAILDSEQSTESSSGDNVVMC